MVLEGYLKGFRGPRPMRELGQWFEYEGFGAMSMDGKRPGLEFLKFAGWVDLGTAARIWPCSLSWFCILCFALF